ncbi:hypothetical protein [Brevibacillus porteri]|uniref:Uncharacterized protein n=1 Tax=Brevibacillus porteri TaxID=2126350 RepID=A0ABX5FL62_9BACL|nr:hypothetical protein [Brevibacillus porteri]MED1800052.1 hypothetical protein [Brevibacillus porteri]MED2134462.1 hypothetical protein [Brevibacillus porteri]MED2747213.1 hypothetical protein [Brevibacillus porteri]MED2812423.1 hypothetical protein [Brevibacillus porteri]MED2897036.1 hypothetical protein [Brevibacillus porteri]
MEKRKKWDLSHWVTPGVFSGSYVVDEAVQRISIVKANEKQEEEVTESVQELVVKTTVEQPKELVLEPTFEIIMRETDEVVVEQVHKLEQEVMELKEALASWEERWEKLEGNHTKQLQYLYQVVLSLKKEWEIERNEHRNY